MENSNVSNLAQTMIDTLNIFHDNNASNAKPDPVPEWDEEESFEGWHKEVKILFKSRGS